MTTTADNLADLEAKAAAGEALTRGEAERVLRCPDLPGVGALGETARKRRSGDRVTYGRVLTVPAGQIPDTRGEAGEVRLTGRPASTIDACERVAAMSALANGSTLTAFSLADLLELVNGDHLALAELASALRQSGLVAVAEVPLDALGDTDNTVEVVRAVMHGGLGAWRATVDRATADVRLDLIERAVTLQRETGALKAFAPLARLEDAATPSTGYDDVRTIAVAALDVPGDSRTSRWTGRCTARSWRRSRSPTARTTSTASRRSTRCDQGPRRTPKEDVERQIRAAFAVPVARDGRYGTLA